ncbi:hypothetical protein [Streptomyces sp. NPDC051001]|uniref:hypothetical protein n=1 Tax=Streptomyces sp. NPDC051001 TaxID=3155795 RepID=UPI003444DAFF
MTLNDDVLALLVVITVMRVFLPDLQRGLRRLLRAGARVGVAELLRAHPAQSAESPQPAAGERSR